MIKTRKIDGATVTYKDDQATRDAVFETLLEWYFKHKSFNGESVIQCDKSSIDAHNILGDIAYNNFEFDADLRDTDLCDADFRDGV